MRTPEKRDSASAANILLVVAVVMTTYVVVTSITGVFARTTPVPLHDSWHVYRIFERGVNTDFPKQWFGKNNEHRIVITRLLVFLDMLLWPEQPEWMNQVAKLASAAVTAVGFAWMSVKPKTPQSFVRRLTIGVLIFAALLAWVNGNNLVWPFQSQIYLSLGFAMASITLIGVAAVYKAEKESYTLALSASLFLGVLCVINTANGIVLLPIITLVMAFLRFPMKWVLLSAVLSALVIALHGVARSEASAFEWNNVFDFMSGLVSGPFVSAADLPYASPLKTPLLVISIALGVVGLAGLYRHARNRDPRYYALLTITAFLAATLLALTISRSGTGVSITSRYATTVIAFWIALVLLTIRAWVPERHVASLSTLGMFLVLMGLMPSQSKALQPSSFKADMAASALAIELGVASETAPSMPNPGILLPMENVIRSDRSMFGRIEWHDLAESMGARALEEPQSGDCSANVRDLAVVGGSTDYLAISIESDISSESHMDVARIVDADGYVAGYAVPSPTGWKGYVRSSRVSQGMRIARRQGDCTATLEIIVYD